MGQGAFRLQSSTADLAEDEARVAKGLLAPPKDDPRVPHMSSVPFLEQPELLFCANDDPVVGLIAEPDGIDDVEAIGCHCGVIDSAGAKTGLPCAT